MSTTYPATDPAVGSPLLRVGQRLDEASDQQLSDRYCYVGAHRRREDLDRNRSDASRRVGLGRHRRTSLN